MQWPKALCPNCRKALDCHRVYCPNCLLQLTDRVKQDRDRLVQGKLLRGQRQERAFLSEFDKRAFELVIGTLKAAIQITVTQLIEILAAEGFFDRYRTPGWKAWIGELPTDIKLLKFNAFARRRVIALAKWWAVNEVAFIGTKVAQGHPYLFYLGKKPDALFDPTLPMKSKAQFSVNKVIATLKTIQ